MAKSLLASVVVATLALVAFCVPAYSSDCTDLTELECAISLGCIVQLEEGEGSGYICRAAEGICEQGSVQVSSDLYPASPIPDLEAACVAKTGCAFEHGDCYCPPVPTLLCVCGGGLPPMCRSTP